MKKSYLYGGSWNYDEARCFVMYRNSNGLSGRYDNGGFCVCLIV